jgi:hypothetical protein
VSRKRLAKERFEVERVRLPLTDRAVGWVEVLVAGRFGGVAAPRLFEYRVLERTTGRVVLAISDDDLGTDYLALLQGDLASMTTEEFAAEWKIATP